MAGQPGPDVSARVAWAADGPAIAAVQLRAWRRRYGDLLDGLLTERGLDTETLGAAWQQTLSHPPQARHRALVALTRHRVVGFALTGPGSDPDADQGSDGEIAEFTVDPDETRQGHGSRLLQACADTLVADGFDRAVCWVDTEDDPFRAFLTDAGWAADGASRELADEAGTGAVRQVRLHTALR